jgi:hypothetical protein
MVLKYNVPWGEEGHMGVGGKKSVREEDGE